MKVKITPRTTRNKQKAYYTLEWGKKAGQRMATGIFTYVNPVNPIQEEHNKEAFRFLEIKKSQLILDAQAIGTGIIPAYRFKSNFLEFYKEYVCQNRRADNRHLECSYSHFKKFVQKTHLSPIDVTETLSAGFQKYLLDHLNGETPANYFARYKQVLKAATGQGYFKVNPSFNIPVKANKNKRQKNNLEAEDYVQLINSPALNEEIKEAFIFCCYTGLRWCDVKLLAWKQIKEESILFTVVQQKTAIEQYVTLHPIAKAILDKRRTRISDLSMYDRIFRLPTADGANKILNHWCEEAGLEKHITWSCARLSFSILLQDANVDAATVALLLGHSSTKYVNEVYKRYRPKDQTETIQKLPHLPSKEENDIDY